MTVLELREVLLTEVADSSTAHSWVMTLGIFTVCSPLVCVCRDSNRPQRNLRARSDALGINIEGNRELVGLFKLARARILQHATSDWPDLVPGLVDDMEEAIRQLPKGMTLAKQYPEVFDEVTHAPAVVPQVIPSLPIPSPSAVPPPSCLPSSGSGAVVSVPPARGDRHINLRERSIRLTSTYRRDQESRSHRPPIAPRPRNKPVGWRAVRSPLLHQVCPLTHSS